MSDIIQFPNTEGAMREDLAHSGLVPANMMCRIAKAPELAAAGLPLGTPAYVIPYHDPHGEPWPFYRVRRLDRAAVRYLQLKESPNYIYYPLRLLDVIEAQMEVSDPKHRYLIITEGEKKAAAANEQGFAAIALAGVDSWRTRTLLLPGDTKLTTKQKGHEQSYVKAVLPSTKESVITESTLAVGFKELIDLILQYELNPVIIFDTDPKGRTKSSVQRAAAMLAHELRHHGVATHRIKQIVLPTKGQKVGLDDFIQTNEPEVLANMLWKALERRGGFPRMPDTSGYLNKRLQQGKLTRKDASTLAAMVLTELDARGKRLLDKATNDPFYFDEISHKLMPAGMLQKYGRPFHETPFGAFLYREYGLSAGDTRVVAWLATQFTGEPPIEEVRPRRVLAIPPTMPEHIAYQISDSKFAIIGPDERNPIRILTNGSEGLLFQQDQVEAINEQELMDEFKALNKKVMKPWWLEVLGETEFAGGDNMRYLATLIAYTSPWLLRWRGTQLPVELMIGEATAGKSSIYSLRLNILTGRPVLRNAPEDLRDWYASISSSDGMHVVDNVHFTNKDLRQRISDEMCRIVTEPDPHIELRKLYTTSEQIRIPVRVAFAMTAIEMPFSTTDLIQRALILNLNVKQRSHEAKWVDHRLHKYGGRTRWVAHHLLVLHRFLHAAIKGGAWDDEYQASHRLAHYEQNLMIMADVLGIDSGWIPEALVHARDENLSEADMTLQGLKTFADFHRANAGSKPFTAKHVSEWAQGEDGYSDNKVLTNARTLGKYIKSHMSSVAHVTGIVNDGTIANRQRYKVSKT